MGATEMAIIELPSRSQVKESPLFVAVVGWFMSADSLVSLSMDPVTNPRPYSSINLHTSKQAAAWTDKQKKDDGLMTRIMMVMVMKMMVMMGGEDGEVDLQEFTHRPCDYSNPHHPYE